MAESCTIYCKVLNLEEIARLLHSHFPSSGQTTGDAMMVHRTDGSLRLTQKVFRERGDDFCRLLLGTHTFVDGMPCDDQVAKKALLNHIITCKLAIGVVAEPAFDADERYNAVVFAIAKALDGVIFNGQEMLDANGATLLASA